ncbi:MAG: serine/threonine protein kinase [Oliverpabstia sp.]
MNSTWPGWQTVRPLGKGSFGTVYEIYREEFGFPQRAALKVITIPQSPEEIEMAYQDGMDQKSVTEYFHSFVEELVSEFALMYQLKGNNTNVVSYEDHMVIQHEDGIGWDILIRMELLKPLPEYIKEHPLSEMDVIHLGIDICHALEICRNYGLIHRDIKPENIFWSEETGYYKLGDFGVARVAEKTVSNFSKKGTYSYMAPEVYRGLPYSFSVDIYSLGILLYRYLNHGRLPFLPKWPEVIKFSDREKALEKRIRGEEIMPDPDQGSEALKKVVLKACAHSTEQRYKSAAELRQDLEAVEAELRKEESVQMTHAVDESETSEKENLTVGFFGEKPTIEKEKTERKKKVVQEIVSEEKIPEVKTEEKVKEKSEDRLKMKRREKNQKTVLMKMPKLYRILGIAVPVLVLIISCLLLIDTADLYSDSFVVNFNVPFQSGHIWECWGVFYYSDLVEVCQDFLKVIPRLLFMELICMGMGNLFEVLFCGQSHLVGKVKRSWRIFSGLSVFLILLVLFLQYHKLTGYFIAFFYQIRCLTPVALAEVVIVSGLTYLISRKSANILISRKKQ